MPRIYYIIPDLFTRLDFGIKPLFRHIKQGKALHYIKRCLFRMPKPVGGIKVTYQHCLLLRELGYEVHPVLMGKYHGNFFNFDIEPQRYEDIIDQVKADDIVVSTEFMPYQGLLFEPCKKILFLQNLVGLTTWLKPEDRNKSYLDLGYDHVITCSDYCSENVRKTMSIPVTTITNGIDLNKFHPKDTNRVQNKVLAMSRKNPDDLKRILELTSDLDIEIKVVDGLTQDELISEYQSADIFIATGYPEGFSLPPLEAMACGCVVVGFTGGAGKEFMIEGETALTAEDGDCLRLVDQLKRVASDLDLKNSLRQNGIKKAQQYGLEKTKAKLKKLYHQLINL